MRTAAALSDRRRLTAMIDRRPSGAHRLELDFLGHDLVLSRDDAQAMHRALREVDAGTAMALMRPFAPAMVHAVSADMDWLKAALGAFMREVAFEDGRPTDRLHPKRDGLEV